MTHPSRGSARRTRTASRRLGLALTMTALYVASTPPLASAAPSPSAADHDPGYTITTTVSDPNDTRGRLDIASVRHRIRVRSPQRVSVTYRVKTYTDFATSALDRRHRHFVIELHRDSPAGADRNILVSGRDGRLVAEVISNATREVIATAEVTRPNRHTVRVRGPRHLVGARSYFAYSDFHSPSSPRCGWTDGYRVTCQDTVPERGWIRMDRPAWPRD